MDRLKGIKLSSDHPFDAYQGANIPYFDGLCQVNLFTGANNTGKSRFLRGLFNHGVSIFLSEKHPNQELIKAIIELREVLQDGWPEGVMNFHNLDISRLFMSDFLNNMHKDNNYVYLNEYKDSLKQLVTMAERIGELSSLDVRTYQGAYSRGGVANFLVRLKTIFKTILIAIVGENLIDSLETYPHIKKYYIPILRGTMALSSEHSDSFGDLVSKNYGFALNRNNHIFSGLTLYKVLRSMILGEPEERDLINAFEEMLSLKFFNGARITLIPRDGDDFVHIKIGSDKQFPVYNLGDGLQQLIILLFYPFINQRRMERSIFFIEEPEISMHPSFQRAFIDEILSYDQHQFFITTHSNHVLEVAFDYSDVAIYLFEGKTQTIGGVKYVLSSKAYHDRSTLKHLGVLSSSVFLSNSTIWVEGVTDRKYLKLYMSKYIQSIYDPVQKSKLLKLKEDKHYSFVEYQGAGLVHWNFNDSESSDEDINAAFLCSNAILVVDGDSLIKGDRKNRLTKMLGERLIELQGKEIENTIPEPLLKEYVRSKINNVDTSKIIFNEYQNLTGLGSYLDNLFSVKIFKSTSGDTVKSKRLFEKGVLGDQTMSLGERASRRSRIRHMAR